MTSCCNPLLKIPQKAPVQSFLMYVPVVLYPSVPMSATFNFFLKKNVLQQIKLIEKLNYKNRVYFKYRNYMEC